MHLFTNIQNHRKKIRALLYTPIRLRLRPRNATLKAMDRVDFLDQNEFHIKSRRLLGEPTTPTMISLLLKSGIAKNEKQALLMLVAVILATLGLTFGILFARTAPQNNTVVDKDGNVYQFEEYIELVRQGKDPLLQ
jgi:hypothetical protein